MKYFDYISTTKINMLSAQQRGLPFISKLSAGLSAGFGGVTGEIKAEAERNKNPIKDLERVEKKLRLKHSIGTIDKPADWFEGEAKALAISVPENFNAVFYFVRTGSTYLALGGSKGHMTGADKTRKRSFGLSFGEHLVDTLLEISESPFRFFQDADQLSRASESGVSGQNNWSVMIFNQCHRRQARTFDIPIRFLAKRIKGEVYQGKHVLLGTPLYIERV